MLGAAGTAWTVSGVVRGSPSVDIGDVVAPIVLVTALAMVRMLRSVELAVAVGDGAIHEVGEASGDWVWIVDRAGHITASNTSVTELLGWRPEDLIGRQMLSLVHPDERPRVAAMIAEVVGAGRGWQGWVTRVADAEGGWRHVMSRARPRFDRRGAVEGFVGSCRDVTEEIQQQVIRRAALEERRDKERRIHDVLIGRTPLRVALQPIADIPTGRTIGFEALARFDGTPPRPPDVWFTEAAEIGLLQALEVHAVRAALRVFELVDQPAYLSINVSPGTLTDRALVELLTESGVGTDRLALEMTEHSTVDDYVLLGDAIGRLRAMGVRIAVDDAGAGYSSMRHIMRIRPDIVKLDRSITSGIDADPVRRAMTGALVRFAADIDAIVVAEGVETPTELEELARAGVGAAQGYLLGRPMVRSNTA